jgi:predicted nucleotidyltransferase
VTIPIAPIPGRGSPRLAWVKDNARELIAIAAALGACRLCLCGSVARGTDGPDSDIDFYIYEFQDDASRDTIEHLSERDRADELVKEFRARSPYKIDVRGLPGWLLDPPFEATMRRDAIELERLVAE